MVTFVSHREVNYWQLIEIAKLKSLSWKYSIDSQIEWIEKNTNPWDIHLLIDNVAYCHLTPVILHIDNELKIGLGIGSVCTLEPGKGYGQRLMNEINQYLGNKPGLLFCRERVVKFYEKYNWQVVDKSKLLMLINDDIFTTMIYNVKEYESIKYEGRLF